MIITYIFDETLRRPKTRSRPFKAGQAKLLEFITAEIDAGRPFPKPTAICKHMGWRRTTSARDAVSQLSKHGVIRRANSIEVYSHPRLRWDWELAR